MRSESRLEPPLLHGGAEGVFEEIQQTLPHRRIAIAHGRETSRDSSSNVIICQQPVRLVARRTRGVSGADGGAGRRGLDEAVLGKELLAREKVALNGHACDRR